jgi:hypothetical protein
MSLAMYAAPFDNDNNTNTNTTNNRHIRNVNSGINNDNINDNNSVNDSDIMNKKRQHNKTQKRYNNENHDQQKVDSVLATIQQNIEDDSEDNLGDFNPPPPPQSIGVQRAKAVEESKNVPVSFNNGNENDSNSSSIANNIFRTLGKAPQPLSGNDNNLDLNNFSSNYADNKTAEEYYSKYLPGINNLARNKLNKQYYQGATQNESMQQPYTNDLLLQKINYMINLLEEQQDEKTNNVTEEVVLYSFLGIFIIFVVDSFARVGKYTR